MPHEFYSKIVKDDFGHRLGEPGSYGSGIVFVPKSPTAVMAIQRIFVDKVEQLGMKLIGWRTVPTGMIFVQQRRFELSADHYIQHTVYF